MELLSSVLRWTARSTPQLRWNPSPNAQEPCRIKFTDSWCKVTRELWEAISILFQYTKDKRVKRLCENRCTTSITTHHCIYLDKQMYIRISNCKPISISITHHDLGKAGVFSKRNNVVWVQYTGIVWYGTCIYLHTIISKHHCIRSTHLSSIFLLSCLLLACTVQKSYDALRSKQRKTMYVFAISFICIVHLHRIISKT